MEEHSIILEEIEMRDPGENSNGAKDEVPDPITGQDRHETRVE